MYRTDLKIKTKVVLYTGLNQNEQWDGQVGNGHFFPT